MTEQRWTRKQSLELKPIVGWFEGDQGSIVTLTKGKAHVVHRGHAGLMETPEAAFGEKPQTIMERLAKYLQ